MRKIGLIKLRSVMSGQDPALVREEAAFLRSIDPADEFAFVKPLKGILTLFFIETGGSEIYFKDLYERYPGPYYLLVQGSRNSLAASLEILSFLRQKGLEGHLIQGTPEAIHAEIAFFARAQEAKLSLQGVRLGVIGKPSDWLIASDVDYKAVQKKFGIELVDISIRELLQAIELHKIADEKTFNEMLKKTRRADDLRESFYIHGALRALCETYRLSGFTLRCFDLVKKIQQTSCLAFSILNRDGIVAGCEGDVPSLLTMRMMKALTGQSVFMANPARIDPSSREAVYAHCTCPLDMLSGYALATHFESGLGFGIRGDFRKDVFTAAKLSPDLASFRVLTGSIAGNLAEAELCRSQIKVKFDQPIEDLIEKPYGNHLLFTYGNHKRLFDVFFSLF